MCKVAILAVVVAMVICAKALPFSQFDFRNDPMFNTEFRNFFKNIPPYGSENNDMSVSSISDGNVFAQTFGSGQGSEYHKAIVVQSVKEPGQPTKTRAIIDDNGKISKKEW